MKNQNQKQVATTSTSANTSAKTIVTAYGNGNDLVYAYSDGTYSDGKNHAITTRASGKRYIVVNGLTYSEREKQADGTYAPARKGASGVPRTHKNSTKHYAEAVLNTEVGCAYTLLCDFDALIARMVENTANGARVANAFITACEACVDKTKREALVQAYEAERAQHEAEQRAQAEAEAQARRERAKAVIIKQLIACGFDKATAEATAEATLAKTAQAEATAETAETPTEATTGSEC